MARALKDGMSAEQQGRRVTLWGVAVNLALIALKLAGGFWGRSQALIADAVHSVSDLLTDVIVLVGLRLGRAPADKNHHFGHGRLETLASLLVGLFLLGAAVYLGFNAAGAIYNHTHAAPNWLALAAAAVSLLSKEVLFRATIKVGRSINSSVVEANAWHHRSDALSSVAVLIGVAMATLNPKWHIADAFTAFLVSFFILKVGLDVVWKALREFTDTAPNPQVQGQIISCALEVPAVHNAHDLKVRVLGGRYHMEMHVEVDGELSVRKGHAIAKEVEGCLRREFKLIDQVIIHVDPYTPGLIG
jgi:cation diffusion facilitator family transporter